MLSRFRRKSLVLRVLYFGEEGASLCRIEQEADGNLDAPIDLEALGEIALALAQELGRFQPVLHLLRIVEHNLAPKSLPLLSRGDEGFLRLLISGMDSCHNIIIF